MFAVGLPEQAKEAAGGNGCADGQGDDEQGDQSPGGQRFAVVGLGDQEPAGSGYRLERRDYLVPAMVEALEDALAPTNGLGCRQTRLAQRPAHFQGGVLGMAQFVDVQNLVAILTDEQGFRGVTGVGPGLEQGKEEIVRVALQQDGADGRPFFVAVIEDGGNEVDMRCRLVCIEMNFAVQGLAGGNRLVHQFGDIGGKRRCGGIQAHVHVAVGAEQKNVRIAVVPGQGAKILPQMGGGFESRRGDPALDHIGKDRVSGQHLGVRQAFIAPLRDQAGLDVGNRQQLGLDLLVGLIFLGTIERSTAGEDANQDEDVGQKHPAQHLDTPGVVEGVAGRGLERINHWSAQLLADTRAPHATPAGRIQIHNAKDVG